MQTENKMQVKILWMDKNLIDAWANMLAYGESDPAYQELRSSFHENYVEAIRLYENTMNHIHL